jgi:hypothetical protein
MPDAASAAPSTSQASPPSEAHPFSIRTAAYVLARAERVVVPVLILAAFAGYSAIYAGGLARTPVRSDGFGYFIYLPAVVVHGDPSLERVAADCCGGRLRHGIRRWPGTGRFTNQYPIGVAVLTAPVYAAVHALSLWSGLPADGFSPFYQHGAGLSAIVALGVGLVLLRRVLRRTFSPAIVAVTLVLITLATNLVHYATWDPLYSHVYSFALICGLLYVVPAWYQAPTAGRSLLLGAIAGLIVLVRHPNALFLLLIPLYAIASAGDLMPRARLVVSRWKPVLIAVCGMLVMVLPQLALYRAQTGRWLVSAYGNQWFDFAHPEIVDILFSVSKGLFFWSPILLLAVPGFFLMRGPLRAWRAAIVVVLVLHTYLLASWWDWQLGSSYGHRGFTDTLGLLALPLAASLEWVARRPRVALPVAAFACAAIALSIAQMIQIWAGVMPMDDVSWSQYRRLFLRFP